jgi:hypothetical protein
MAPKGRTELKVGPDSVAVITIINPPVNSLSIDGSWYLLSFVLSSLYLLAFSLT